MDSRLVRLSKTMSWLLRHGANDAGVAMDKDGSVLVTDMLKLPKFRGFTTTDVMEVVRLNEKKRFEIQGQDNNCHACHS